MKRWRRSNKKKNNKQMYQANLKLKQRIAKKGEATWQKREGNQFKMVKNEATQIKNTRE
jgi:hypothetical protein